MIDDFLAPDRFDVAGLHGGEHRLAGRLFPCRPDEHPDLRRAVGELQRRFAGAPGILIEDKGCSVAALAPRSGRGRARSRDDENRGGDLGAGYRLQLGKAVAEVLPARASKGGIIRHLKAIATGDPFIGDDLTDEQASQPSTTSRISIRVGSGPTRARYRIGAPSALRDLLGRWARLPRIDFTGAAGE